MARLQTLLLPDGGFAFVVDQHSDSGVRQWREFALNCGARDILITEGTIRILEPFAESPTEPETTSEPEPDKPWEIRPVHLDDAPEIIQRFIGAAFGAGPFAELHQPCGDDCGCAATTDDPTPEKVSASVAEKVRAEGGLSLALETDASLTEREKRVEKILATSGTVQRLDESGEPAFTDGLVAVADAFERRQCGAMNGAGVACSLPYLHPYLHNFGVLAVSDEAAPEA